MFAMALPLQQSQCRYQPLFPPSAMGQASSERQIITADWADRDPPLPPPEPLGLDITDDGRSRHS